MWHLLFRTWIDPSFVSVFASFALLDEWINAPDQVIGVLPLFFFSTHLRAGALYARTFQFSLSLRLTLASSNFETRGVQLPLFFLPF